MQALLGTRLSADINLVAQLLMLAALWVGFYFARTRQRTKHKNTQTTVVLVQLVLIAFVMVTSFWDYVIAGQTFTGIVAQLMIIHGGLGLVAEGSGIYLVLRMRTQLIPPRYRVRNFKLVMRSTIALWTAIVVLGSGVYYFRYLQPEEVGDEAPLEQLLQAGDDLVKHAAELRDAIARGNLETAKRHAEHLVNLIEGRSGENYGDLDKDGTIEDPGDSTGLLPYLRNVDLATTDSEVEGLVGTALELVEGIIRSSLSVIEAAGLASLEGLGEDTMSAARKAKLEGILQIGSKAKEAGVTAMTLPLVDVPGAAEESRTVTVVLDQFRFKNKNVTIRQGWTVAWINNEAPKHTATADDGTFNSGSLSKADTFEFTFNETGTFPYYCRFHGDKGGVSMAGTVTVLAAGEAAPEATPTQVPTPEATQEPAAAAEGPTPGPTATPTQVPTPTTEEEPEAAEEEATPTPTVEPAPTEEGATPTPTAEPAPTEEKATPTPTPALPTATPKPESTEGHRWTA